MNALLSGPTNALSGGMPPPKLEPRVQRIYRFPSNMASAAPEQDLMLQAGGSESNRFMVYAVQGESFRKPPQREGAVSEWLAFAEQVSQANKEQLEEGLATLRVPYLFRNETQITQFLLSHRGVPGVLMNAVGELSRSFGDDILLHLDVLADDGEPPSLYVIVMWRGPADDAEAHLEDFDERWWLNQPAQPGLTFTYELV